MRRNISNSQIEAQQQLISSNISQSNKNKSFPTQISVGQQEKENLSESCTTTEDQQSHAQKVQQRSGEKKESSAQILPIGVVLSSNSEIQADTQQEYLIETPTNLDRPKDIFEVQEKMESKKYYTMSCVKRKNQFQKKYGQHKSHNTDGLKQQQLKYRDSLNELQKSISSSSGQSYAFSKQSQVVESEPFTEEEDEEQSHSSSAPYVTAFEIGASPKKKRVSQRESQDISQLNASYDNQQNKDYLNQFEEDESSKQEHRNILQEVYDQIELDMQNDKLREHSFLLNDFVQQMRRQYEFERRNDKTCKSNGGSSSSSSNISKRSSSLFSQSSSTHQIWDNIPLQQRGIDTDRWVDLKSSGDFKNFTLFHLYKARFAQLDGVPISNHAVVDIMRRFIRNKRVEDISGYPWFSFDDKLDYADIDQDLQIDPLCKVFVEYSHQYSKKRRQNKNNTQLNADAVNQTQKEKISKFVKSDMKLSRDQLKTELSLTQLNSDSFKHYPQTFITETFAQPNILRNSQRKEASKKQHILSNEIVKTVQSQNTCPQDTYEKIDLENIQAVTQASEECGDKNFQQTSTFNHNEFIDANKSPQFGQNFSPNFEINESQAAPIQQDVQQNRADTPSLSGMIYNNLMKCETTQSFSAEDGKVTKRDKSIRYENSPDQSLFKKDIEYIQTRQRQILEKITSTPIRIKNSFSQVTQVQQPTSNVKTVKKAVKQVNTKQFYDQDKVNKCIDNSKAERKDNSFSSSIHRTKSQQTKEIIQQFQETPLKKKSRDYSCATYQKAQQSSSGKKRNSFTSYKKKAVSSSLNRSLPKNNSTSNNTKQYQETYYNNDVSSKKQKSAGNVANSLSLCQTQFFLRNSADGIIGSKERMSYKDQGTKKKELTIREKINETTPNKREAENQQSLQKKDFKKYFHNDYARYYNKRKYVSTSCDKILKLSYNTTTIKKKNLKSSKSPNPKVFNESQSTEQISEHYQILSSVSKNQRTNENQRTKLLQNYISNHPQNQTEDPRSRYQNFTKNVTTTEFIIEDYLNANLDQDICKKSMDCNGNQNNQSAMNSMNQNHQYYNQNNITNNQTHNFENITSGNITNNNNHQKNKKSNSNHYQFSQLLQQLNKQKFQEQNSLSKSFYKHLNEMKPSIMNKTQMQIAQFAALQQDKNSTNHDNIHTIINSNLQKNKLSVYKALKNKQILKPYQQQS